MVKEKKSLEENEIDLTEAISIIWKNKLKILFFTFLPAALYFLYLSNQDPVKPIFKRSCFDCHGVVKKYPWYYKIPGVKHYIDYDISESKSHLDLTKNFPFMSHSTPLQDLKAISKTVKDGSMPPFRYWIMHRNSRLKETEKKIIENWVIESIGILKN